MPFNRNGLATPRQRRITQRSHRLLSGHERFRIPAAEFAQDFLDWWYRRPDVRGPKPKGVWRRCITRGCDHWFWVRPSFVGTPEHPASYCSFSCAGDDGAFVRAGSLRWSGSDPTPEFYPFLQATSSLVPGYDLLMKVDTLVKRNLPEDIREEVCQNTLLAIIEGHSGGLEELVAREIKQAFKMFGRQYAPLSLDMSYRGDDDRVLGEVLGLY